MAFIKKLLAFVSARYAPRGARQSFSQSGEDIVMSNLLKELRVQKPFYIDIGAHEPIFGNNTYLLYRNGGTGLLVEPNSVLAGKIKRQRPKDKCVEAGVGRISQDSIFYRFPQSTRSTFSREQADEWSRVSGQQYVAEEKRLLSLDELIDTYVPDRDIDVLSIDAEGLDFDILSSFSWKREPAIICLENEAHEVESLFEHHGYRLAARIFQNAIFIKKSVS